MEIKQHATENTLRQMKMEIHHTKHAEYSKSSSRKKYVEMPTSRNKGKNLK